MGFLSPFNFIKLRSHPLNDGDLPGSEFWVGGEIVREMDAAERKRLTDKKVKLYENPQKMFADISDAFLKSEAK